MSAAADNTLTEGIDTARSSRPTTTPTTTATTTPAPRPAPDLPLPHERDQSTRSTAAKPDKVIAQAKRDLDAGLVDTDMHATAGIDAQRREAMVPTPPARQPRKR